MSAKPISVQLYSVRREVAEIGMERVLQRVAALGFPAVEPAGLGGLSPERFRRVAAELGLRIPSAHVPLPCGPQAEAVLDEQEALGTSLLISSGGAAEVASGPEVQRLAERLEQAAQNAAGRGMSVGYHNHWWEFDHLLDGGRTPYEILLELAPSVFAEVDIYWSEVGGQDTVALLRELGARARLLHVKDGPVDPPTPHTAVGAGKMRLAEILSAAPQTSYHVVELDECATDVFAAIEESYRFLTSTGLSEGRTDG